MKYLIPLTLVLLTAACSDQVTLATITQASKICEKNGGTSRFRLDTQPGAYMYVSTVRCVDGAIFDYSRLKENKK